LSLQHHKQLINKSKKITVKTETKDEKPKNSLVSNIIDQTDQMSMLSKKDFLRMNWKK